MMLGRQILTSVSPLSHAETRYPMLILIKNSIELHLVILEATAIGTFDAHTGESLLAALKHQGLSSELLGQRAATGVGSEQFTAVAVGKPAALVALRA